MTPPPPAATAAPRVAGGRRLSARPAARIPRRVSGPARPRVTRALAGNIALPRPIDLRIPRPSPQFAAAAAQRVRGLFGGRGLIVVLAAMLLGLVFLQVSLLKLNTAITQNVERADALERDNAAKRTLISQLDAGRRIEDVAGQLGMVMPGAGAVCYLNAQRGGPCSGGDPAAAASAIDPATESAPVLAPAEAVSEPAATAEPTQAAATEGAVAPQPAAAPEPAPVTEPAPAPEQQASAPAQQEVVATGGIAAGDGQ